MASRDKTLLTRRLPCLLAVAVFAACQGDSSTAPGGASPQFDISEARFGDGNPDFFFGTPLAANPSASDPEFDQGAANGALVPYIRICVTDGTPNPDGCTEDVTLGVTDELTGLAMSFTGGSEQYQANLRTRDLDEALDYRIEVWGAAFETEAEREALLDITFPPDHPLLPDHPRWLFGWLDISNSPSTASCDGTAAFCLINYGQTVPVTVRIEDFVFCPVSRNCAVQFVAGGVDANLEAILDPNAEASSVQLFIPGQSGTDFALAFEPCSSDEVAAVEAFSHIPTFGPCLKTLTPPGSPVVLDDPATFSFCLEVDEASLLARVVGGHDQLELAGVHHFSTGGGPDIDFMEAWPHATPACDDATSGGFASAASPQGFVQLAQAAGRRLLSLFQPTPLLALDLGGGGEGFKLESFFRLGLPTKFEYEFPGDDFRTGVTSSDFTLRAKTTDLDGNPVWNARVDWDVFSSPGGDASVSVSPVMSDSSGISEVMVRLSDTEGDNVFHASGRGIADPRESGCIRAVGTEISCNGPRTSYDPFQPDASALLGGVEVIPEGTHLPFTVFGCAPGRGTPDTVDGTLADGEWACANSTTFPVNLSGGSGEATLYWMHDDDDFHIAVSVPGAERRNGLRIDWDSDGDAPDGTDDGDAYVTGREAGDDVWEFEPGSGPADKFIDEGCSGSSQAGCGSEDTGFGGAMQTAAAFDNSEGGITVYEMSHPLNSGDTCTNDHPRRGCGGLLDGSIDLAATTDDMPGFFVTLRLGNGAQGNTQWPGFLEYLKVTIR